MTAETGSFSAAAEKCCVTQSAISQQIKSLENENNLMLFERAAHKVKLTDIGKELLPYARKTINAYEELKERAKELQGGTLCGELRVGIGSFIEPYLRKAAAVMTERYPNLRISVVFGKATLLNEMLRKHELDIAFTMNTAYEDEGIISTPVLHFYLSAIMKTTHPLSQKEKVTFDDLMKYRCMLPTIDRRAMDTIKLYLNERVEDLNIAFELNDADAILKMLQETNNMIGFLPNLYTSNTPMLCAKPIEGLEMLLHSNVHYLRDTHMKRSAKVFLELVKEYAPLTKIQQEA